MKKNTLFLLYLLCFLTTLTTLAQTQTYNPNGVLTSEAQTYIYFTDPAPRTRSIATATLPLLSSGAATVTFTLKGGDGGTATWDGIFTDLVAQGGQGGTVVFTMPITPQNQGQTVTFYQGKRGESFSHPNLASGGGGASTAIVDHNGTLLAVAGGGGGGCAVEAIQSNGLPGGTARDGIGQECTSKFGIKGSDGTTGQNTRLYMSNILNQSSTGLSFFGGGGGGLTGVAANSPNIHSIEITGKASNAGGWGGYHPAESFQQGASCDPGNPFGLGCYTYTTLDVSRGGSGYSGGGAGGPWLNSGSSISSCTAITYNLYGAGGAGGGYTGGGAGDKQRGGGGGSSFIASGFYNTLQVDGSTVTNSQNGFVLYQVSYDTQNPVAVCQNTNLTLGVGNYITDDGDFGLGSGIRGEATLNPIALDGGSTDDGYIANRTASQTQFNCSNLGANTVSLTVTDGNGNTDSCTTQVTVIDDFAPTITAATSNIINASGFGLIDMGTNMSMVVTPPTLSFEDNCAVANVQQAVTFTVTCADIGTSVTREVIATDTSGNVKTLILTYTITGNTSAQTIYVSANQPDDSGDGISWATAKKHLNSALALIDNNICNNQTQIWVAAGTYYPDEGTGQTDNEVLSTFSLRDVGIYGGFAGTETTLDQRNIRNNVTILSGDLQQNDMPSGIYSDNAYHLVTAANLSPLAMVDGFTITAGNANGPGYDTIGGAIICNSPATFKNCIISGNSAGYAGGAIFNTDANPTFINCIISGNTSNVYGGAIWNSDASPTFINCTLSGNSATSQGGAIYNSGASSFLIQNSIIWNNRENGDTTITGASVYSASSASVTFNNCFVANVSGDGIISSSDPLFVTDIDFNSDSLPTTAGDFHTQSEPVFPSVNSGIINIGNSSYNNTTKDLDGNVRVYGENIDLGPYEKGNFPSYFITKWETTTPNESITIPTTGPSNSYLYQVDWNNDGVFDDSINGFNSSATNITHVFPSPGIHTITIRGYFTHIYFNNTGDKDKIISIEQWSNIYWLSMSGAFRGCSNLTINATDSPNLSEVSDLSYMFAGATSLNQDLSNWDVSNSTNMESMFSGATSFNQDMSNWNVSNATNMTNMFEGVTLTSDNYDALLNGWSSLSLQNNVTFNGGNSLYCQGEPGRDILINTFGWTISDWGKFCVTLTSTDFEHDEFSIYPNPSTSQFTIKNPSSLTLNKIEIYDITGRLVKMISLGNNANEITIDISNLTSAPYIIKIVTNKTNITKKLIKN